MEQTGWRPCHLEVVSWREIRPGEILARVNGARILQVAEGAADCSAGKTRLGLRIVLGFATQTLALPRAAILDRVWRRQHRARSRQGACYAAARLTIIVLAAVGTVTVARELGPSTPPVKVLRTQICPSHFSSFSKVDVQGVQLEEMTLLNSATRPVS